MSDFVASCRVRDWMVYHLGLRDGHTREEVDAIILAPEAQELWSTLTHAEKERVHSIFEAWWAYRDVLYVKLWAKED